MNEFINLNVSKKIITVLDELNINTPTPIQEGSIPLLIEGNDVIGQAQTGTGKTFAYGIPLVERINEFSKYPTALVMCPTRELSLQVSKEISKLIKNTKIKLAVIYGGEAYEKQFKALKNKPNIIIGTPGRIIDHLNRGTLDLSHIDYLVLDEADEMLKMGFKDDMELILSKLDTHQTALFSATMPPFIKQISKKYMLNPKTVAIETKTLTADKIRQLLFYVKKEQKNDLLLRVLDYYNFKSLMIFANTKAMVDAINLYLQSHGFKCDALHGDLKQSSRDKVMQSFRDGFLNILIATDVAARGIDVKDVEAIINYDIPNEQEVYVHRIGRTGRAGAKGLAITFATTRQANSIRDLESYTKSKMEVASVPSSKDIATKFQKNIFEKIVAGVSEENHDYDNLLAKLAKETTDPTPIIISLLKMLDNKREYGVVDNVSVKNSKSQAKEYTSKYANVLINVGSSSGIRPNMLVNYLHDELKIHREHFGKISVEKDKTYFEIKNEGLKYLKALNGKKFNGKKLSYQMVRSMPRKR